MDTVGRDEEDEEEELQACERDVCRDDQARCRARCEDRLEEIGEEIGHDFTISGAGVVRFLALRQESKLARSCGRMSVVQFYIVESPCQRFDSL